MDAKQTVRQFLSRQGGDNSGRSLNSLLAWSDDDLESHHDFIQWLFPLDQASRFNPEAPVLTQNDFAELGRDPNIRTGLRDGFRRMLNFYGLEWRGDDIAKSSNWDARSANWAREPTHNDLRITRILHSLTLCGLHAEAKAFLKMLEAILQERPLSVGRNTTLSYWQNALVF
jgi:hypothetical protein